MRSNVIVWAFFLSITFSTSAFAQPSQVQTPKSKRANETLAAAIDDASRTYVRTREKELATWLRAYEKSLAAARAAGDQEGIDYLTDAIARSKRAGFVVKPAPQDAVRFQSGRYALIETEASWHVAKRECEMMGGHLLTIETAEEARFVNETFGGSTFYVGAGDFVTEGEPLWITGRPFDSFGFATSFDNGETLQHAIAWLSESRRFEDELEGRRRKYVCEWE